MTETEGGLEKVAEVLGWRDSNLFSPSERLALEYGLEALLGALEERT